MAGPGFGTGAVPVQPQNGMGTAAMILGIVGLLCCPTVIPSILAIVFGVIGNRNAKAGTATNGGMAMAGLIMGIVGVVLAIAYWILNMVGALTNYTSY